MRRVHKKPRADFVAYLWFGLATVSVVLAFIVRSGVMIANELDIALPLLLVLGVFLYGKASRARGIARRLAQPTVDELLVEDQRPPVLYLRSFGVDSLLRDVPGGFVQRGTEEEQLVQVLGRIGPVVAIGKPGEGLPELGAARLYLDDAEWQQEVMRLMDRAALVVLLLGPSGGLWWELRTAYERLEPRRLVILSAMTRKQMRVIEEKVHDDLGIHIEMPARSVGGWRRDLRRWDNTETARANELARQGYEPGSWTLARNAQGKWRFSRSPLRVYRDPDEDDEGSTPVRTRIDALYWFDLDRQSHHEAVGFTRVPWFRRSLTHAAADAFLVALRPVFVALGVAWQSPPIAVSRLLLLAAVASLFVAPLLITLLEFPSKN